MSNDKTDVEKLLDALSEIQEAQVGQTRVLAPKSQDTSNQLKLIVIAAILASLLPIGGIIYQMGAQKQELFDGIDRVKLEMEASFTKSQSIYKDELNRAFRETQGEVKDLVRDGHEVATENERLGRRIDDLEDNIKELNNTITTQKREIDDQYRTVTYLRSLHNANIPQN